MFETFFGIGDRERDIIQDPDFKSFFSLSYRKPKLEGRVLFVPSSSGQPPEHLCQKLAFCDFFFFQIYFYWLDLVSKRFSWQCVMCSAISCWRWWKKRCERGRVGKKDRDRHAESEKRSGNYRAIWPKGCMVVSTASSLGSTRKYIIP